MSEEVVQTDGIFVRVVLMGDSTRDDEGLVHVTAALEYTPGLSDEDVWQILQISADGLKQEGWTVE